MAEHTFRHSDAGRREVPLAHACKLVEGAKADRPISPGEPLGDAGKNAAAAYNRIEPDQPRTDCRALPKHAGRRNAAEAAGSREAGAGSGFLDLRLGIWDGWPCKADGASGEGSGG
jgi:hypothetical protein